MCNIIDLMFDLNTEENNIHIKTKSMLNNGLNFISDSIDHFLKFEQQNTLENTSENILFNELKYSVLHLHSGIALVLKSVLFFNHWTYIFSDMNKASQKELNDGSFKSVESNKLISRLEQLCNIKISQKDINKFEQLRNYRNKFEHFMLDIKCSSDIQSVINYNFDFIIRFIEKNYQEFSMAEREIDNNYIIGLTQSENEFLQEIIHKIKKIKFQYNNALKLATKLAEEISCKEDLLICPHCKEKTLTYGKINKKDVFCFFCGYEETCSTFAHENYIGFDETHYCPYCGNDTFVFSPADNKWICYSCNIIYEDNQIHICSNCKNTYETSDENIDEPGLCPQCIENKIHDN